MKSHCLFPLPLPSFKGNDNKDIKLVKYKEKFAITCINRESNFIEVWIIKDYNEKQWSKRHSINMEVLTNK